MLGHFDTKTDPGESMAIDIPQEERESPRRWISYGGRRNPLEEALGTKSATRRDSKLCDGQDYEQPFWPSKRLLKSTNKSPALSTHPSIVKSQPFS